MRIGVCGTMESNDCLITIKENGTNLNNIEINSIVSDFFYDQILNCVNEILKDNNIKGVDVIVNDKGALDFTIKARTLTALERMMENA